MLKYELHKLYFNKFFIPAIIAVFLIWVFMLYNTSSSSVLVKSLTFWKSLGSLTFAFIILMVSTKMFSIDREEQVEDLFNATKHGKRQLFLTRLYAATLFTTLTFLIFTCIQIGVTASFIQVEQIGTIPNGMNFITYFILQNATVLIGAVSFTVFTAVICNFFKSHPITLIICGLLFGISFITHTSMVDKYSLHWLLDKGFFSYLVRGHLFSRSTIDFVELASLVVWYSILLAAVMIVNKNLQRRRKEL